MPNIILSYRRSDTDVISGRIRDRLAQHFGADSVYMDIDSIPFGIDFRDHIKKALLQIEILVAVIGPNWIGRGANPRILDETDPVRIEVETALQRGIPVVPVLVAGANMPMASDLPDGMKDLAFRNAATVDGARDFHLHMDRLIRSLDMLLTEKQKLSAREPNDTSVKPKLVTRLRPKIIALGLILFVVGVLASLFYRLNRGAIPSPQVVQQLTPQSSTSLPESPSTFPTAAPPCVKKTSANAFFDNFKTREIGWQPPIGMDIPGAGPVTFYQDDALVLAPPVKLSLIEVYPPLIFSDVNVCARIKNPPEELKTKNLLYAGLVFWFQDAGNYYAAELWLDPPSFRLYRNVNRSWLGQGIANTPQIKTEPSAINEIQIVTKGNLGAQYVNGTKVGEFKGQPLGKAPVGIIAQGTSEQKATWGFLEFSASEYQ